MKSRDVLYACFPTAAAGKRRPAPPLIAELVSTGMTVAGPSWRDPWGSSKRLATLLISEHRPIPHRPILPNDLSLEARLGDEKMNMEAHDPLHFARLDPCFRSTAAYSAAFERLQLGAQRRQIGNNLCSFLALGWRRRERGARRHIPRRLASL